MFWRRMDLGGGFVVREAGFRFPDGPTAYVCAGTETDADGRQVVAVVVAVSTQSFELLRREAARAAQRAQKDLAGRMAAGDLIVLPGALPALLDHVRQSRLRRTIAASFVVRSEDAGQAADLALAPYPIRRHYRFAIPEDLRTNEVRNASVR